MQLGRFQIEIRWSWVTLLAAYAVAGSVTALAGGHVDIGGPSGIVANAAAFAALALGAALFHELGHALAGLAFHRRPLRLVLKAGAAMQIEGAREGSRGDSAAAESLVALSGPIASGLIGLAYFNVSTSFATPFAWAGLLAIVDALVNLVPGVARSDGDRVLHAFTDPPSPAQPTGPAGG